MAIKLLMPGLARLGRISIGEMVPVKGKEGVTRPNKLDHFEIRTNQKGPDGALLTDTALMARMGERPTSLRIRLPFNNVEMNFATTLAYFRGNTRYCWGDGETAQRLKTEPNGGKPTFGRAEPYGPCGEACRDFDERRCKPMGVLSCILEDQQQVGGIYLFRTTSWRSIRNIQSGLQAIQAMTGGILAWIPLTMRLVSETVQPKGGGAANTAYIVQIVYEGSPQHFLTEVRDLLALRAPLLQEIRDLERGLKGLPSAVETSEDAEEIQKEFYPDNPLDLPTGEESGEDLWVSPHSIPETTEAERAPSPTGSTPPPAAVRDIRPRSVVVASVRALVDQLVTDDADEAVESGLLALGFATTDWETIRTLPMTKIRAGEATLRDMVAGAEAEASESSEEAARLDDDSGPTTEETPVGDTLQVPTDGDDVPLTEGPADPPETPGDDISSGDTGDHGSTGDATRLEAIQPSGEGQTDQEADRLAAHPKPIAQLNQQECVFRLQDELRRVVGSGQDDTTRQQRTDVLTSVFGTGVETFAKAAGLGKSALQRALVKLEAMKAESPEVSFSPGAITSEDDSSATTAPGTTQVTGPDAPTIVDGYVAVEDVHVLEVWAQMCGQGDCYQEMTAACPKAHGEPRLTPGLWERIVAAVQYRAGQSDEVKA